MNEHTLMSIGDFCRMAQISKATFFNWQQRGLAPQTMKVGQRVVRISQDAVAAWEAKARESARAA